MSNIDSELHRMDQWLGGILAGLSPAARTQATRKIAQYVRGSQSRRIGAQKNPDGSAFAPRRARKEITPSNKTLKFLYPEGGSGPPRTVLMKSWALQGAMFTGYDVEAEGIRSFAKSKIIHWLRPTPEERARGGGSARPRARNRAKVMFRMLRRFGYLRAGSTGSEAWVGFTGLPGHIASVSQYGEFEKPAPKQEAVRYAQRQLLGLSDADETHIIDMLVSMFDEG